MPRCCLEKASAAKSRAHAPFRDEVPVCAALFGVAEIPLLVRLEAVANQFLHIAT